MEMNVIAKSSSQFYRKRFSTSAYKRSKTLILNRKDDLANNLDDVQFDLVDSVLRAAKNGSWAPVCNNDYSYDYTSSICKIFGYGLALIDSLTEKTRTLRRGWSVECIREPFCFSMDDCNLIKCSMCNDGICGDGSCVKRSQLCNLKADCQYGEDEMGCDDISGICGIRRVEAIARDPRRTRLARVVGGFETKAGAFPWTAAVKIKAVSHFLEVVFN
uniref:SRCR domain-containing protein n=1 Tax=Heterorhabditis bacteriophora TaxID=37862 RepID=A0A1I7X755_HETBA